jgi:hypothetical protein
MSMLDLRMMVDEALQVGELVHVDLQPENWPGVIPAAGMVHASEATIGGQLLGVFLSEPLPADFAAACWLEMRRELRYPCNWPIWVRFGAERRLFTGMLRNYSRSGLQLQVARPVRKGETVTIVGDEPLVDGVVRWAAPHRGNSTVVGCAAPPGSGLKLALRLQTSADRSRRPTRE